MHLRQADKSKHNSEASEFRSEGATVPLRKALKLVVAAANTTE
jgi:hypothetical protein